MLPHLTLLGVDVIDERPYELAARPGDERAFIYDFGLSVPGGARGGRDALGRPTARDAVHGRVRRVVLRAERVGRLQRAGDGGRARLAPGRACCARSVATCARPGRPTARPTSPRRCAANVEIARPLVALFRDQVRPGAGARSRRPGRRRSPSSGDKIKTGPERCGQPRPRPDHALVPGGDRGRGPDELLPVRTAQAHRAQAAAAARSPTCPSRGRSSRSSSTPRGSRACTCGSARWPAAGCAGRTGPRTSGPRSSAWSRRRW